MKELPSNAFDYVIAVDRVVEKWKAGTISAQEAMIEIHQLMGYAKWMLGMY